MQTLFESELKVMEILWEHQPVTAKQVSMIAAETVGWNKNTTYTMLKKLEAKGLLTRADPGFVCTATVSRVSKALEHGEGGYRLVMKRTEKKVSR